MAREFPAREDPQHRDHGPHRRGQDHHDRAHPLLHRPHLQDRRGARGRRGDGPHGPGAGARHHDHVGRDHRAVARLPDQHHRHARPRRLHHGGRAQPARARRRGRGVRRGRGRRAADRDRVAPGQQVQRAALLLRQQDGPHRRRLRALRLDDPRPPRRGHRGRAAADRRGERVPRRDRPRRDEGDRLAAHRRQRRRQVRGRRHPRPSTPTRPTKAPARAARDDRARRRRAAREVPRRRADQRPPRSRTRIRLGTLKFEFVPVLCGSAFKNKGVQPMLDAVVDYLPSPLDLPPTQGTDVKGEETVERKASDDEPFAALAFKIVADPYGKLTYFRIYSGTLEKGAEIYNSTKDRKERIGRILRMHADQREDIDVAYAGDIVAGLGFKQTTTGDTLCERAHPIILERMEFPTPVISVAIEPKTKNDQDKLGKALDSLSDEDPTFVVHTDPDTGPDDHRRHGRAAPRGARRPDDARVQRRRARRQAAGRLPRDDHRPGREGRAALRPPDRRSRPVRPRRHRARAHRPRRRLRVRRRDQGRRDPARVHPRRRRRHPGGDGGRRARGLPARRRPRPAHVRFVPRRRQLGDGVQDRGLDGVQGSRAAGPSPSCSNRSRRSRS